MTTSPFSRGFGLPRRTAFGSPSAAFGVRPTRGFGVFGLGAGARELLGIQDNTHMRRCFSDQEKVQVWIKGREVPGFDLAHWRYDDYGNIIRWSEYGNPDSAYGWEIDHITALAVGGTNAISNLRPLRCSTNRGLGGLLSQSLR